MGFETPKTSEKTTDIPDSQKESISDPSLVNLVENALEVGRESQNLEDIKQVAEKIAFKLQSLGATNLPLESKLGEAYISASKVKESYQNIDEARSAMKRIAKLISGSDGFKKAVEVHNKIESFKMRQKEIDRQVEILPEDKQAFIHASWKSSGIIDIINNSNLTDLESSSIRHALSSIQNKLKGKMSTDEILELEKLSHKKYQNEKAINDYLSSKM